MTTLEKSGAEMTTDNMLLKLAKEILKGKDLTRTMMNLEFKNHALSGKVLDIGGGNNPSYFRFFKKGDYELINLDSRKGDDRVEIDLEKDNFPYNDNSVNQVLMINVLEHIYYYKKPLQEARRVLKDNGELIGFVPFLVGYHPDPNDYFRYTGESLKKIFQEIGFSDIKIKETGRGPFAVAFDSVGFIFPIFLRIFALPFYYFLDFIAIKIKPELKKKFPLGYFFILKK